MPSFVEQNSAKDLRRTGNIYNYLKDTVVCEHGGIHKFYIGKKNLELRADLKIDPETEVINIVPYKGNIFIESAINLKYKNAVIIRFRANKDLDRSKPVSGYVKLGPKEKKHACTMYFKNSEHVHVEFDEAQSGLLTPGMFAVLYNRGNEKGKIIGSGLVDRSGVFTLGEYNTLPKIKDEENDEDMDTGMDTKFNF
jgi:tRNA U34 2-thiouridine synthase MnmA/TrmU